MAESVLVVNAGSSSIKFEVFDAGPDETLSRRIKGKIDGIGTRPRLVAKSATGEIAFDESYEPKKVKSVADALGIARARLRDHLGGATPFAAGHRVVHGGPLYSKPVLVNETVLEWLQRFVPLAPLHQPNNLAPIREFMDRAPEIKQVACFDTAFHRNHPALADRYAIPERLYTEGVRRYGFHGLSYEYIAGRLPAVAPEIAKGRVVIAHLGSGASLCALVDGQSIESTMGFTALDGVPMGTRCGQIDPGVVLYLLNQKGMKPKEVEQFLYNECGLRGLSGLSSDARDLLSAGTPQATLAIDFFAYRIALMTGSLIAAMQGIDGFVFTAGIGENAPAIRSNIAQRLNWFGLELDPEANERGDLCISKRGARVPCYVIATDEELMIARHTLAAVRGNGSVQ